MIEKEEYNEKQVPKMSWKFLSCSRSRSLFLRVCRQLRWTSATEFFVLLNRSVGQTQLVHRERQGEGGGGGERRWRMERSKPIHPLFRTFGFLWSRLLTPHVCSAQASRTYFREEKIKEREEEKKKGCRNEEKKRARTESWG